MSFPVLFMRKTPLLRQNEIAVVLESKTPDFSQAYFFNIFIHPIVKFLSNMMTLVFKRSSRSIKLKRSQIKFVTFFVTNLNVSNIMSKLNKYCLNIIKLQ